MKNNWNSEKENRMFELEENSLGFEPLTSLEEIELQALLDEYYQFESGN